MAHSLEIPDPLFSALVTAAKTSGKTPVEWIAEQLARKGVEAQRDVSRPAEVETLADLMAGRLGRVHSGGAQRLSEACGEKLTDHLVTRRREGHL